jgi:hypothetical protein
MKKLFLSAALLLAGSLAAYGQASNGRVTTNAPTYANGSTAPLSLSTGGLLRSLSVITDGTDVALVDGSGNLSIVCSNCSGSGASDTDDSTFTAGTDVGAPIGGVVTTDDVDAGDFGIAAMTDDRALHVIVRNDDGTERTTWAATQSGTWDEVGINDSGNSITVDGTVTVTDGAGALNTIIDSGSVTVSDGAGALNVIVDSITAGDNDIGNVDLEIAGTVVATSNGAVSAQTLRVANASDNSAIPLWGHGATAAAVPANAVAIGTRADGGLAAGTAALTTPISCTDSVAIDGAASGNTELVALTASETIYVCGYSVIAAGTVNFQLIYGTGTACATGETNLTGDYNLTAQAGIVDRSPFYYGMKGAVSNALCYELSGAVAVDGVVYYTKY